jgi:5'-3' exonuclease
LLRVYADERPHAVVVGWDSLDAPTKRHEMFPAYQSGREFDAELIEQLNLLPEFVAAFGFANAKAPGFEADDFLAAAVAAEERAGGSALVASGDRDSFQLASPSTSILYPSRGGELARIGPEEVRQRYGVDPKQVPDFIALRGDPSDKLPGAAGVGSKRALGSSFCSPSVAQGRSHPLSRNDFSSQRLETARVATLSQHSVSDWIKNEPAKLFGEPQRPPTLVCPGAGGVASNLTA